MTTLTPEEIMVCAFYDADNERPWNLAGCVFSAREVALARRCAAAEARLEAVREYAQLCADEEGDDTVSHIGKTVLRLARGEE